MEETAAMEPLALAEYLKNNYPSQEVIFLGDAADIYIDSFIGVLGERAHLAPPALRYFMAASAACYGFAHLAEAVSPAEVKAFYLRPSSAEKQRKERLRQNGK